MTTEQQKEAKGHSKWRPKAPLPERIFSPEPKQAEFLDAVFSERYKIMGFGGAVRGGKTIAGIMALFILCKTFPGSRWAIVREDLQRLRQTTIPTIEKFAPRPFVGRLDRSEWKYRCQNGSEILIVGEQLGRDPDLDRFKGLEVNGWLAEEANEISEQTANKMIERMGSWIIQPSEDNPNPAQPPALLLCTFNPADNWVREWFYEPSREGRITAPYYFLQALPTDNKYNTQQQWESWKLLPTAEYKRFIEGDWSAIVDPYQLITYGQILEAANVIPVPGRKREGLDVASGGDDDTVFALIDGNIIDGDNIEREHHWDEPTTATRARERMVIHGIRPEDYKVDSIGVGSGVYNLLRRWGYAVRAFIAGASYFPRIVQPQGGREIDKATGYYRDKPPIVTSGYRFKNVRSQAWWEFADGVKQKQWCIINPPKELIRDLTAARYKFVSEREIYVDNTDEIKERTGHSPDYGTAVIQAAFDFPKRAVIRSAGTTGAYIGR
jgi:hypothetical protein